VRELAKVGFGDIRDLFDADGRLKRPGELSEAAAARVSAIEVVTRKAGDEVEYIHKIRLWDKVGALVQLGRHLGMWKDKTEVEVRMTLEQLVLASMHREVPAAPAITATSTLDRAS